MSNDIALFAPQDNSHLPAHLQARENTSADLAAAFSGTTGVPRISLKGNRFTLLNNTGEEEFMDPTSLNVIVLGAIPSVSRVYYASAYDPKDPQPPACWSQNGKHPNDEVGAPQSHDCRLCPMNQKGSSASGQGRACQFRQYIAVMHADTGQIYRLDLSGQSVFGDSNRQAKLFSWQDYVKGLAASKTDPSWIFTRLTFDPEASTVKVMFSPMTDESGAPQYLSEDWMKITDAAKAGEEYDELLKFSFSAPKTETASAGANLNALVAPAPAPAEPVAVAAPAPTPAAPAAPAVPTAAPVAAPPPPVELNNVAEDLLSSLGE